MTEENKSPAEERGAKEHDHHDHHHPHLVTITVDGKKKEVEPGSYIVAEFKRIIHVDASKELEEVQKGQLIPLDDAAKIKIKGGEQFVSHVRRGGSS